MAATSKSPRAFLERMGRYETRRNPVPKSYLERNKLLRTPLPTPLPYGQHLLGTQVPDRPLTTVWPHENVE